MNNCLTISCKRLLTPSRRSFLCGLGASIVAPYVAKAQFNQGQSLGSAGVANSVGGGGGGGYVAQAVRFDGALMPRPKITYGTLIGVLDSPLGLLSCWTKMGDVGDFRLAGIDQGFILLGFDDFGFVGSLWDAATNSRKLNFATNGDVVPPFVNTWRNTIVAWNTNFAIGSKIVHIALQGVLITGDGLVITQETMNAEPVGYETEASYEMGVQSNIQVAEVADPYFALGQFLDIVDPTNIAKFIVAGKPVWLGSDGSLPTGTAPAIFHSGGASEFANNKGTGGTATLTGTLTNASTSPSD